jgi:hypothetical protein
MEERALSNLDLAVLFMTFSTALVGSWSIHWARAEPDSRRCRRGRILFIVNLLAAGAAGLVAAFLRAQGLPPLGLVAGLLIVGILWESPVAPRRANATSPVPVDHAV